MPPQMKNSVTLSPRFYTIGHSNHTVEHFLGLLKAHDIQVVVDARSQPYSKYATQFDHETLKPALQDAGIRYLYLGRELGGRPEGEEFYDSTGHVLYDRVSAPGIFQEGLSRLERGIREYNVALLCAEENPAACHRRLLVGRVLLDRGIQVEHIRGDGRIQSEEEVAFEADPNRDPLSLFQKAEGGALEVYSIGFTKKTAEQFFSVLKSAALLKKALFRGSVLFGNISDRVAYREFDTAPAKESLLLAKPAHPSWIAKRTPSWKKQLRVRFHLDMVPYDLAVTDIPYDTMLKDLPVDEYSSAQLGIQNENELYFTISLGEPLDNGYCFKLVAAVLQLPNGWPSLE